MGLYGWVCDGGGVGLVDCDGFFVVEGADLSVWGLGFLGMGLGRGRGRHCLLMGGVFDMIEKLCVFSLFFFRSLVLSFYLIFHTCIQILVLPYISSTL